MKGSGTKEYYIFLASPGDVNTERQFVARPFMAGKISCTVPHMVRHGGYGERSSIRRYLSDDEIRSLRQKSRVQRNDRGTTCPQSEN